jgi:hypothetical protein
MFSLVSVRFTRTFSELRVLPPVKNVAVTHSQEKMQMTEEIERKKIHRRFFRRKGVAEKVGKLVLDDAGLKF